ncbi:AMP-binding protein [Actinomadura sp. LD22]|uniref:AMP-binding protein n=1 Tax=Actinomadura physcomitrii TaxID=2650748 RepID=A0A6I4MJT2_9ACTN|nr:acyl-CoA synthetase [Actinomadura physcomitrii]MWA02909.1 AMP-binding protein [Actinomadura physcomitrii]
MAGWNIADVLDVVAQEVPDAPAVIQGERRVSWAELDARAEALGAAFLDAGLGHQAKVALYLRNSPAYVESLLAALKVAMVPVNTNYRYSAGELTYLWDNADAEAVVFDAEFTAVVDEVRHGLPKVRLWLQRADGSGAACPDWAVPYDEVAASGRRPATPPVRSGDDLILLYTGGTTGMPKGVMWRQDDVFVLLGNAANGRYGPDQDLEYARRRVASPGRRLLPAAPLMHGAGVFSCVPFLARGGAIVLLEGRSFDAGELLDTVEREQVWSVGWVGDAFAKPVLEALDREPGRWDLSGWRTITSGGVMFSQEVKQGLLAHVPQLLINDVFGASEAITIGSSTTTKDGTSVPTGSFTPRKGMRVIRPDGTDVVPGSGEVGLMAFAGRQPLGYYKDEAKTAATFLVIGGERYSVPGDYAVVAEDGTATLLGRGSACINTGGEKVFAEEVEQVIKRHPDVADAVVVGIPDDRFGEAVTAVVELEPGRAQDPDALVAFVRGDLAGYKAPKRVFFVDQVSRGPNGKADLKDIRSLAIKLAGVSAPAASA